MSDIALTLVITLVLIVAMFLWIPLLHSAEALGNRHPLAPVGEMPDLVEEDTSPQFTGKVA